MVWEKNNLGFSDKLNPSGTGPFKIERIHANGTLTIRLNENETERINIRRIKPVFK
jgi:hypothetical protein